MGGGGGGEGEGKGGAEAVGGGTGYEDWEVLGRCGEDMGRQIGRLGVSRDGSRLGEWWKYGSMSVW